MGTGLWAVGGGCGGGGGWGGGGRGVWGGVVGQKNYLKTQISGTQYLKKSKKKKTICCGVGGAPSWGV